LHLERATIRAAVGIDIRLDSKNWQIAGGKLRAKTIPAAFDTSDGLILYVDFATHQQHWLPFLNY
jgi:hypothetical protein